MFCQSEVPNGHCDLGSLNSVVAVFSGGVTIVKKFCNFQFFVILSFNLSNSA